MAAPENVHEAWWIGKMSRYVEWVCLVCILVPLVLAYRTMPAEDNFANGADEGYYMRYAKAFADEGMSSIPKALRRYLDTPKMHRFPHPGRFGFTVLGGIWIKIFPDTYRSLAHMSFVAAVLFLALSYYFCRRYLGQELAALYTLLLACSPLVMGASRRVLQDSVLNLFWALPFWLFFEYLMTKRRWAFVGFCATLVAALTIKEASVFLFIFFVPAWLVFKFLYARDLPNRDFLWLVLAPPLTTLILYLVFLGGWANLSSLLDYSFGAHLSGEPNFALTSYAQFGRGPWFKYLVDFLMVSPWPTVLCIGYVYYLLTVRKLGPVHAYGLLFYVVIYALLASLRHTKVIRFAMSLEMVSYLFAVLALLQLVRSKTARNRWNVHAVGLAVLLTCYMQIRIFWKIFVEMNTYDTISPWLLVAHKIIPYFSVRH